MKNGIIGPLLGSWLSLTHCHAQKIELMKHEVTNGNVADLGLLFDGYSTSGNGLFPIAIYVHGDNASPVDAPVLDMLTKASFTWFSINYRLALQYRWPAGEEDVQSAIRWVKKNGATYKGDTSRIATWRSYFPEFGNRGVSWVKEVLFAA